MYRYKLHSEKNKQICPNCHKRRFVRYIDTNTGDILPNKVGRCDREINCGYHLMPKDYFKENGIICNYITPQIPQTIKPPNYHNYNLIASTNKNFEANNFIQFLHTIFNANQVHEIVRNYRIGSSKHWKGATIFWQIDNCNRLRGGKIMLYNKDTGKRTKFFTWVHSVLIKNRAIKEFTLKQCLFGLHLINHEDKPIAIVESEKTACIMSQIFKKYIWLATGGLSNLNKDNLHLLKNKKIVLYPDLGIKNRSTPFDKWKSKMNEINEFGFKISISTLLENKGTNKQREKGYDIADYFLNQTNPLNQVVKKNSLSNNKNIYNHLLKKNKNLELLVSKFDLHIPP
jgi:shikimate kinase